MSKRSRDYPGTFGRVEYPQRSKEFADLDYLANAL